MASNVFRTKAGTSHASDRPHGPKPQLFSQIVGENEDKLPLAVEVIRGGRYSGTKNSDNNNIQLHKGDILWVTKANVDSIAVSTESSARRKESAVIIPPDWSGKFQLSSSDCPAGHTYTTVAELATDFPIFVTVKEELDIDGVTVKPEQRLKLLRQKTTPEDGKFLQCVVTDTGDNVLLPETMRGKFQKSDTDTIFEAKDLTDRLPLHVQTVTKRDEENGEGGDKEVLPGIPLETNDESLLLTSVRYAEALLWETTSDEIKEDILKIPNETKMEVILLENWQKEKGPSVNIMELAKIAKNDKPVYAVPSGDSDAVLEELGLASDSTIILHPVETVERILVKGLNSHLLVNKQYRGYFKPQTEYGTGHDLVNFGIQREVKVTQEYHPNEEEIGLSALFINDKVKLNLHKPTMFATDEDTEIEVVQLERTLSKSGGHLGMVYVPASTLVGYQECIQYSVDQKLSQLAQSQVPISASFTSGHVSKTSTAANTNEKEEEILREESPLTVLGIYKYPVVRATVINKASPKDSHEIEISEHAQLKVHRVRRPSSETLRETIRDMQSRKTDSAAVKKVSKNYFDKINQAMQQLNAYKEVKRRRGRNQNNDNKRKSWVQRNLSFKAIQNRLSKTTETTGTMSTSDGQNGEEWSLAI